MADGAKEEMQPAADTPGEGKKPGGKRRKAGAVLLVLAILGAVAGFRWWVRSSTHVTTDDAFVESTVHSIAPRIPGTVVAVKVADNQAVKMGDLLVELDSAGYDAKVREDAADVALARNETSGEHAQVAAASAAVDLARARLEQAGTDLRRGQNLLARDVVPREQVERLETAHKVAAAQLREAQEALRKARTAVGAAAPGEREARVAKKVAALTQSRLNLGYTKIYAPADGYITRKSVEVGNYVQPGQGLMALVALDDAWVVANYKERQLTHVRPGQQVELTVDAYPGRTFTGHVESIMAGTGASFSLLPPENATGNYVKVVQRIPVKIVIDKGSDPAHLLRVGMSVVPTIDTERNVFHVLKGLFGR